MLLRLPFQCEGTHASLLYVPANDDTSKLPNNSFPFAQGFSHFLASFSNITESWVFYQWHSLTKNGEAVSPRLGKGGRQAGMTIDNCAHVWSCLVELDMEKPLLSHHAFKADRFKISDRRYCSLKPGVKRILSSQESQRSKLFC